VHDRKVDGVQGMLHAEVLPCAITPVLRQSGSPGVEGRPQAALGPKALLPGRHLRRKGKSMLIRLACTFPVLYPFATCLCSKLASGNRSADRVEQYVVGNHDRHNKGCGAVEPPRTRWLGSMLLMYSAMFFTKAVVSIGLPGHMTEFIAATHQNCRACWMGRLIQHAACLQRCRVSGQSCYQMPNTLAAVPRHVTSATIAATPCQQLTSVISISNSWRM
jgi:hypothetical protein